MNKEHPANSAGSSRGAERIRNCPPALIWVCSQRPGICAIWRRPYGRFLSLRTLLSARHVPSWKPPRRSFRRKGKSVVSRTLLL